MTVFVIMTKSVLDYAAKYGFGYRARNYFLLFGMFFGHESADGISR